MSHLATSIASKKPDKQGVAQVSLNDLSDVTATPSPTQALKFDGSAWMADTLAGSFDVAGYAITNGTQAAALGSPAYSSSNELYGFYMSARHTLSSDVLLTYSHHSGFTVASRTINLGAIFATGFTVASGVKVLLTCDLVLAENTATNTHIDLQWQTTSGDSLGPLTRIKIQSGFNRSTVVGFFHNSTGADVEVGMKRLNQSGTLYYPQSTETRQEYILIGRKF